ncbi:hypothetical protein BH10PSE4_BH10PSE4_01750 [soil metagenome]
MISRRDYAGPITKSAEAMFERAERQAGRIAAQAALKAALRAAPKAAPKEVRPTRTFPRALALPAPPPTPPSADLALEALGPSMSTLRNWEDAGIIAIERRSGRRVVDEAALEAIQTITLLRRAGFSIKQIAWLSDTLPPSVEAMQRALNDRQDAPELERTRLIYRAKMATCSNVAASMGSRS